MVLLPEQLDECPAMDTWLPMSGFMTRTLRLTDAPIHGTLHVPEGDAVAGVLLIGGSGGSEPSYIAEPLARGGIRRAVGGLLRPRGAACRALGGSRSSTSALR